MSDEKLERIIAGRMKLKARFEAKMRATPVGATAPALHGGASSADAKPQGSGPANRHGMPKLPIGQTLSKKWPVLDLGIRPQVTQQSFRLVVDGACERPYELDFAGLLALPQVTDDSDFHCVTTWSRMDLRWQGVRVADALALAEPRAEATHLMCHGSDGYSTNIALEEACKPDVLLAHTVDGEPLPHEHGGPVRVITPQLYAWKGAKWVCRLELMIGDRPGFWEERGYSMTANPWRDDRYG